MIKVDPSKPACNLIKECPNCGLKVYARYDICPECKFDLANYVRKNYQVSITEQKEMKKNVRAIGAIALLLLLISLFLPWVSFCISTENGSQEFQYFPYKVLENLMTKNTSNDDNFTKFLSKLFTSNIQDSIILEKTGLLFIIHLLLLISAIIITVISLVTNSKVYYISSSLVIFLAYAVLIFFANELTSLLTLLNYKLLGYSVKIGVFASLTSTIICLICASIISRK